MEKKEDLKRGEKSRKKRCLDEMEILLAERKKITVK